MSHLGMHRWWGRNRREEEEEVKAAKNRLNAERAVGKIMALMNERIMQRLERADWEMTTEEAFREEGKDWTLETLRARPRTGSRSDKWEVKDCKTAMRVRDRASTELGVQGGKEEEGGRWMRLRWKAAKQVAEGRKA